ncbi:hypothetical protein M8C21_026340 [Ambrosia artemisiifolia]|uniref:Uncharacterized protein n=1 Tax=Ambrosia artemisiifolia TaxID=4212 RepID=A0AAD5GAG5_AMBAR|nr:hypothetical protein M8C21_026340 [Ambrosia artemisiifolia]
MMMMKIGRLRLLLCRSLNPYFSGDLDNSQLDSLISYRLSAHVFDILEEFSCFLGRSKMSGIKLWSIKSIFSILLLLLIIIVPGSLGWGKGHYATCKIAEAIRLATEADPEVNYLSGMPCKVLEDLFSSLSHFFSEDAKHICDYQLVLQCHIKSDAGKAIAIGVGGYRMVSEVGRCY